jgi:hypothetical protein
MGQHPQLHKRSATVEFDKTWFARPLDWSLRIVGQSLGGYGFIDHSARSIPTSRYGTRADAERAAAIWIETGLTPAYQTDERVAEVRAQAAAVKVAA